MPVFEDFFKILFMKDICFQANRKKLLIRLEEALKLTVTLKKPHGGEKQRHFLSLQPPAILHFKLL